MGSKIMNYLSNGSRHETIEAVFLAAQSQLCAWYCERYPEHALALRDISAEGMLSEAVAQRICNPGDYIDDNQYDIVNWRDFV
jgi:hypothetical protein